MTPSKGQRPCWMAPHLTDAWPRLNGDAQEVRRVTGRIIRPCPCRPELLFVPLRLHARPHSALRTHAPALPPRAPAQQSGRHPCAPALPACACAHAPACSGSSCRGRWTANPCESTSRRSSACPSHPLFRSSAAGKPPSALRIGRGVVELLVVIEV